MKFSVLTYTAKVMKLVVLHCRWCVGFGYDCLHMLYTNLFQKLGLTRLTLSPVSPGMCPHFYCLKSSLSSSKLFWYNVFGSRRDDKYLNTFMPETLDLIYH